MRIFIVGPMASGKTTIGAQLAKSLQLDFFDSDQEIEISTGVNINWIFEKEGEKGFRKREVKIIDVITKRNNFVLSTGGGSILMKKNRINIKKGDHIIYLKISLNNQLKRTMHDKTRPLINLEDKKTTLKNLQKIRTSFYKEISTMEINQDGRSSSHIIKEIISNIHEGQHGLSEN